MRLEMKLTFLPLCWAWLMGIVLAGCSQVPKLPDARTPTIERFRQAPSDRGASTLSEAHLASRVPLDWWASMNDSTLNALQHQLTLGSPSLQVLAAQTRQAQAALVGAQASLWPSLNLNTGVTRSANQLAAVQGTSYSLSAPLSWQIEIGRAHV